MKKLWFLILFLLIPVVVQANFGESFLNDTAWVTFNTNQTVTYCTLFVDWNRDTTSWDSTVVMNGSVGNWQKKVKLAHAGANLMKIIYVVSGVRNVYLGIWNVIDVFDASKDTLRWVDTTIYAKNAGSGGSGVDSLALTRIFKRLMWGLAPGFGSDSTTYLQRNVGAVVGNVGGNIAGNIAGNVAGNIAGNVNGNVIGYTGSINTGGITNSSFADSAITASKIKGSAITSAKIASGAITSTAIATDAIGASQIADNAIDAGAIATDAIGSAEIAANAIGSSEIASGALTNAKFAVDDGGGTDTTLINFLRLGIGGTGGGSSAPDIWAFHIDTFTVPTSGGYYLSHVAGTAPTATENAAAIWNYRIDSTYTSYKAANYLQSLYNLRPTTSTIWQLRGFFIQGTTGNDSGFVASGYGNGAGMTLRGAGAGTGLMAYGGSSGRGIYSIGYGSRAGIDVLGGSGTGTGNGINIATDGSGTGLRVQAMGGYGIYANGLEGMKLAGDNYGLHLLGTSTNSYGLYSTGTGTSPGAVFEGAGSGAGLRLAGNSGAGLYASSVSGHPIIGDLYGYTRDYDSILAVKHRTDSLNFKGDSILATNSQVNIGSITFAANIDSIAQRIVDSLYRGGAYQCTLLVLDNNGNEVAGINMIMWNTSGHLYHFHWTGSNGIVVFGADPGTYYVSGQISGWNQNNQMDTVVVTGSMRDTVLFTAFDPGTPTDPLKVRLYQCSVKDPSGTKIANAKVTIELNSSRDNLSDTTGAVTISRTFKDNSVRTDADGFWHIDVYRNDKIKYDNSGVKTDAGTSYTVTVELPGGKTYKYKVTANSETFQVGKD